MDVKLWCEFTSTLNLFLACVQPQHFLIESIGLEYFREGSVEAARRLLFPAIMGYLLMHLRSIVIAQFLLKGNNRCSGGRQF